MAITTENQLRSTLGVWGFMRILPIPSGSIAEGDMRHLWGFRFLTDSTSTIGRGFLILLRRRRR